ncbi:hypothetical protein DL96DRAFT_344188 [Flagelloscypha sp. PMI_526]|nr:hypothetical protein DL96DRAFT_344188 [Flagelloscypha sp. PMI_526]
MTSLCQTVLNGIGFQVAENMMTGSKVEYTRKRTETPRLPPTVIMSSNNTTYNLPFDIIRVIFEFSASAHTTGALALTLVSREVQSWSDPHLFKFLVDSEKGSRAFQSLEDMSSDGASPRLIRAREYVRAVAHRFRVWKVSFLQQYLALLPNIQRLYLWLIPFPNKEHDEMFNFSQVHPSLREVSILLPDAYDLAHNAFSRPFWSKITHLQVSPQSPLSYAASPFAVASLFAGMSSLTHLVIEDRILRDVDANTAVSRVVASLPASRELCLLPVFQPPQPFICVADGRTWNRIIQGTMSDRIVVWWDGSIDFVPPKPTEDLVHMDSNSLLRYWWDPRDGELTFWERGEAILKKRRVRQVRTATGLT